MLSHIGKGEQSLKTKKRDRCSNSGPPAVPLKSRTPPLHHCNLGRLDLQMYFVMRGGKHHHDAFIYALGMDFWAYNVWLCLSVEKI